MCNPAAVVIAVTVAAAAFSADQQVKQGKFQEDVADYNARVAENEAEATRNAGVEAENAQRRKTAQLLAKQRAQLGAANVDLSSGSPLQIQQDTELFGEVDALRVRSNFEGRADALNTSADLTESQGEFAAAAGKGAATGTLLQGAASATGTAVDAKWFTSESAAVTSASTPATVGGIS